MKTTASGLIILFVMAFMTIGCQEPMKDSLPNIVLIMADDMGYGDLGCFGSEDIETPNLDALAAKGLRLTDYHSNGPVCTPTRAALMTGRYQQRCGLEGVIYVGGPTRQLGMDTSEISLAEVLKGAGYATGIFGKWHLGYRKEYFPTRQGFDEFHGFVSGNIDYVSHYDNAGIYDWWHQEDSVMEELYLTQLITDHSIDFIKKHRDEPFFAYLPHGAPHWPYQGPRDTADRYAGVKFPSRGSRPDQKVAYKEMIESLDTQVGRIVGTLKELDLVENTLFIFCSDNGGVPDIGSNGMYRGHKAQLWEGGHRVPAVVYWPGRIHPGESDETVMGFDWFPTIVSLSGAEYPSSRRLDGVDLSNLLFEGKALPERNLFWRYRKMKAARNGDWKLVINEADTLLFDLATDPKEKLDLAEENQEQKELLINALNKWEAEIDEAVEQKTL